LSISQPDLTADRKCASDRKVRVLEIQNKRKEMSHIMTKWEIESPSVARGIGAVTDCAVLFNEAAEIQPAPALYCGARKG
jgi:hypothetical protein